LFFGVAFLLRYLAEHSHIPMALRLSGVACGALILLIFGWQLRSRRRGYALALQGGAVGILYLTVFSALHQYSLLSPAAAFALLAAVAVGLWLAGGDAPRSPLYTGLQLPRRRRLIRGVGVGAALA
jgi:uncharacterized membrane protein